MLDVVLKNNQIRIEKDFLELLKNPKSVVVCARHSEIFVCSDSSELISSDRIYGVKSLKSGLFKLPEDLVLEFQIRVGEEISITAEPVFLSKGKFKLNIRRRQHISLKVLDIENC